MTITEKELFERLVTLETEKLTLSEDIKQLKKDAKYDSESNPSGISKEDISLVHASARLLAKNDYDVKKKANEDIFQKYEELTNG